MCVVYGVATALHLVLLFELYFCVFDFFPRSENGTKAKKGSHGCEWVRERVTHDRKNNLVLYHSCVSVCIFLMWCCTSIKYKSILNIECIWYTVSLITNVHDAKESRGARVCGDWVSVSINWRRSSRRCPFCWFGHHKGYFSSVPYMVFSPSSIPSIK